MLFDNSDLPELEEFENHVENSEQFEIEDGDMEDFSVENGNYAHEEDSDEMS